MPCAANQSQHKKQRQNAKVFGCEDHDIEDVKEQDVKDDEVEKQLVKSPDILDYMLQTWIAEEDKENSDAGTELDMAEEDKGNSDAGTVLDMAEEDKEQSDAGTVLDLEHIDTADDIYHTLTSTVQHVPLTEEPLMSDVEPLTDVQQASIWFMCL